MTNNEKQMDMLLSILAAAVGIYGAKTSMENPRAAGAVTSVLEELQKSITKYNEGMKDEIS